MAIQLQGNSCRILFRFAAKQHSFSLGPVAEKEALNQSARVDYPVLRLARRPIDLPPGVGIVDFVRSDGKPPVTTSAPNRSPWANSATGSSPRAGGWTRGVRPTHRRDPLPPPDPRIRGGFPADDAVE